MKISATTIGVFLPGAFQDRNVNARKILACTNDNWFDDEERYRVAINKNFAIAVNFVLRDSSRESAFIFSRYLPSVNLKRKTMINGKGEKKKNGKYREK